MSTLEEEARKILMDQTKSDIDFSFDSLVGKQDRRTIPEHLFVEEFLPFFSGQKPITAESGVISNWMTIAGTPFAEVNVTDVTGNVVVTVPGLNSTLMFGIDNNNKTPIGSILSQAEIISTQQPVLGARYRNEHLDAKQKELIDNILPEALEPAKRQWNDIFVYYGIISKSALANQSNDKPDPSLDEDVDYL